MSGLTYDSGALIAAERNQPRIWAIHRRALGRGIRPVIPAGVLTEVYRAGRQANLARLLVGSPIRAASKSVFLPASTSM
jgi:rRNA-processing protein FCF1